MCPRERKGANNRSCAGLGTGTTPDLVRLAEWDAILVDAVLSCWRSEGGARPASALGWLRLRLPPFSTLAGTAQHLVSPLLRAQITAHNRPALTQKYKQSCKRNPSPSRPAESETTQAHLRSSPRPRRFALATSVRGDLLEHVFVLFAQLGQRTRVDCNTRSAEDVSYRTSQAGKKRLPTHQIRPGRPGAGPASASRTPRAPTPASCSGC